MRSSALRGFLGARTGRLSAVPCRRARQNSAMGQTSQRGVPTGMQTVAPRSMVAWL